MANAWRARTPGRSASGARSHGAGVDHPGSVGRDRGQGTLEYVGVVALAVVLVAALVLAVSPAARALAARIVCEVTTLGQGTCEQTGVGPDTPDGDAPEDRGWFCETLGWFCPGEDEEQEQEEEQDRGWWCETLGWWCPDEADDEPTSTPTPTATPQPTDPANGLPVVDGVTIPQGLDPDDEAVRMLLMTERGRQILQWLADNDISILPSGQGSYWNGRGIFVDNANTDLETVRTLVHEYNHAVADREGTSPDVDGDSREDYVNGMLDEETRGVVDEIRAARELEDAGVAMPTDESDTRYWDAYDAAISQGASEQAAQDAGFAAVREMFTDGTFVTSTTNETYEDYYGSGWDDRH